MSFAFDGQHASEFGIKASRISRAAKPSKRVYKKEIAGRDGVYSTSDNTYGNISIAIDCDYVGKDVRGAARAVAQWLSKRGELCFDDEPERYYAAEVEGEIPLEEELQIGHFTLNFVCFPFARSRPHQHDFVISRSGQAEQVTVGGTTPTPCTILLRNTGTTTIPNIRIERRSVL